MIDPKPFPPREKKLVWLALSGGGFRASLYHLGVLKRLNELGLLSHVGAISATSGGAFTAGLLALHSMNPAVEWSEFERNLVANVRRGILAPTFLLAAVYGCYLLALGAWLLALDFASLALAASGLALHAALAASLLRDGAHRALKFEFMLRRGEKRRFVWSRFLSMLFVPAETRWQTMNLRIYGGSPLEFLASARPKIFLTAVDLNTARETIFSAYLISPLDSSGCRRMYDRRPRAEQESAITKTLPLAKAVAASSALPPWFKPVLIRTKDKVLGCFIDGGVVDNFAVNVPLKFSIYLAAGNFRVGGLPHESPPFTDEFHSLLVADGSAWVPQFEASSWRLPQRLLRLLDVPFQQQQDDMLSTADLMSVTLKVPVDILGRAVGFQADDELHDNKINAALRKLRTHLDSFSAEECAVISYCGYCHADAWASNHQNMRAYFGLKDVPRKTFREFLPEAGPYSSSLKELREHLDCSDSLSAWSRTARRGWNRLKRLARKTLEPSSNA